MKIAVLMPFRNAADTICDTIESLNAQTYSNYELFAVNNNSQDSSVGIMDRLFRTFRLRYYLYESEIGIVPALNCGLFAILGGKYGRFDAVARLDADDIWFPEKLEKQVAFLKSNQDISILGTQYEFLNSPTSKPAPLPLEDSDIRNCLFNNMNAICHPSVMVRTDVYKRCGIYDEIYSFCEDYQYWMKASRLFKFANLPDILVKYRQHHNPKYNPLGPSICRVFYGASIKKAI